MSIGGTTPLPGRVFGVLASLLVVLVHGCTTTFRPTAPRLAHGAGLSLALDSMEVDARGEPVQRVTVRVRVEQAPEGTTLRGMAVADPRTEGCKSGYTTDDFEVAGARWASLGDALRAGDILEARFGPPVLDELRAAPSRLDVLLEDRVGALQCVSFPLVDASAEQRWSASTRNNFGMGVEGWGFLGGLGDIASGLTVPIMFGRWFGPVRVSSTFAPGVIACPRRACDPSGDNKADNSPYLPLSAGADLGTSLGRLRLGLGAAYRVGWARVDARAGTYWTLVHGPSLVGRIGYVLPDPLAPGVPGGERVAPYMGLDIPLSFAWDDRGHSAVGVGAALVWSFPI